MAKTERIRLRALQEEDEFGDPVGDAPPWRSVDGARVVPRSAGDFEQRGPIILSGYMVVLPAGTPIEDTDEIEVRGEVQQIDGSVGDYGKAKILYSQRVN